MILYYIHDPMCSWCWAYRPTLERLRQQLPGAVEWRNLLGGLAPDSAEPMPEKTRKMVQAHWQRMKLELGTEFNFDFWTVCKPRRYSSCRAALAAAEQGMEEEMILAIQEAYYLRAMNPSNEETLLTLAAELGMDAEAFRMSLLSAETEQELQAQISQARAWPIDGLPSLVLQTGQDIRLLPLDYRSCEVTMKAIRDGSSITGNRS